MIVRELVQFLVAAIGARMPVLVQGAPGVGKSDVINAVARECGADLIVTHPAIEDPTDAKGLPALTNGEADFLPFGALRRARAAERLTVWFADDLGQATPAVQSAYMPLLDSVRGHNSLLGAGAQHVVFIAATNRRTDRAGVSGVLEPVKSRFGSIVELTADIQEWSRWAIDAAVPPVLIAYLRFQPDNLCKFSPNADLTNSPLPRTWSHVGKILGMNLPAHVQHAAIVGAVGEGAAVEFSAFQRTFAELPNVDQILIDPNSVPIPTSPAVLYALATALAARTTAQNFGRIAQYIDRMVQAEHGEFGVLVARDAMQRCTAITSTAAFVRLITSDLGELISGSKR